MAVELEMTRTEAGDERTEPGRRADVVAWLVAAAALVGGLCFVLVNAYYNGGRLIPALDDAYIHMQYGAQIGRGEFLRFNDGDPISTGASSLLYVTILGAMYFLGAQGGLLLPAAVLLNIICHALTAVGVVLLGRRLSGPVAGAWAGALVALSGPLLWSATTGMEVSLIAFLLVATLLVFVRESERGSFPITPVLVSLAALGRLEALIFFLLLPPLMIRRIWRRPGKTAARLGATAWSLLPFALIAAQLVFYKIVTGSASPNGSQAKSHLNMPNFNLGELLGGMADNYAALLEILAGISRQDFTFPGALLFAGIGVVYLVGEPGVHRQVGLIIGAGTVLALGAVSTMATALWQQVRYLHPFLPLFLLLVVLGVGAVVGWLRLPARAATALLVVAALFTAVSVPLWAHVAIQDSASIRARLVKVATWANGNLPADARLGVHDVGAAAYLGDNKTVDLIGLTTNGLAEPAINGMGSLYEALREMAPEQRPDYIATYNSMPNGVDLARLANASIYAEPMLSTPQMTVWRCDWSLLNSGDRPTIPVDGQVRDHFDIASMRSEEAHDHEFRAARSDFQPMTEVRTVETGGREVVDSARHIWGEQEFTLHDLEPGRDLRLVARYDSRGPVPGRYTGTRQVRVYADGHEIGKHRLAPDPKGWSESVIEIPAERVTGSELTVRLAATQEFVGPYPDYKSFGFWAVQ
ncbi:hypothetical protein GCM10009854_43080 [Saccharopolyspora halophila]|uniref:Glycosyltransferase RgtA/B/C/D-like domain-containing protein n=1 Tax=Saccharopolyspora halophila TaxID=405551 RepID=A0ABP5TS95_9PSEU